MDVALVALGRPWTWGGAVCAPALHLELSCQSPLISSLPFPFPVPDSLLILRSAWVMLGSSQLLLEPLRLPGHILCPRDVLWGWGGAMVCIAHRVVLSVGLNTWGFLGGESRHWQGRRRQAVGCCLPLHGSPHPTSIFVFQPRKTSEHPQANLHSLAWCHEPTP